MKKKRFISFALAGLMLCLVLAGCGDASVSDSPNAMVSNSSTSVSRSISSSSMPEAEIDTDYTQTEAYQNAEPWQQAYYDVCEELGLGDASVKLLIPDSGIPLLITPTT